jgi:hypothetical protein
MLHNVYTAYTEHVVITGSASTSIWVYLVFVYINAVTYFSGKVLVYVNIVNTVLAVCLHIRKWFVLNVEH